MNEPLASATQAPPSEQVTSAQQVPKMFVEEAANPTQLGPEGIRYDFNNGCRVEVAQLDNDQRWRI